MRLSSTKQCATVLRTESTSKAQPMKQRSASPAMAADASLEIDTLRPAQAVLHDMPDFDKARVEALRVALKEGRIPFDAAKLAGLIQRFHGAKG